MCSCHCSAAVPAVAYFFAGMYNREIFERYSSILLCTAKEQRHFPMNKKTLKITTGAMIVAIFGVLMLINRQTGNMFQDLLIYLFPIPMVAYSAGYGVRSSLPVAAAMILISLLFGTLNSLFFAVSQTMIGLIFGSCIYHKVDMTKVLCIVMLTSGLVSILDTLFISVLFGYDLNADIAEMQTMMTGLFARYGYALPEAMLNTNYLMRMMLIGLLLSGMLQGFITYEVSLLLLRRLRFTIPRPKSVYLYCPPPISGVLAFALFIFYNLTFSAPLSNATLQAAVQMVGMLGYFYLLTFGVIALMFYIKLKFPKSGKLGLVLGILAFFTLPQFLMLGGFFYLSTTMHKSMLRDYEDQYGPLQ